MTHIQLANLTWRAWSPSLFELPTCHGNVLISYDGQAWRLGVRNVYGAEQFATREAAAVVVADCFRQAFLCYTQP